MKVAKIPTMYSFLTLKHFLAIRGTRFLYFASLSYAYSFTTHTIQINKELVHLEKLRNEELQKRNQLEKEILISNLNYLRYQIQPHFLFNTLSFIYTQVMKCSQSASRSVMLLSDIMRYALHDHDDGKTALETEVQHIHNLIEIHQLRFNNSLYIEFEPENDYAFKYRRIVPMLLITFVENLFKYGDVNDPEHPATIKIDVLDDELHFHTFNKKKTSATNMISSGIGLVNVKKRLDLAYGNNKYQLLIDDKDEFYTVDLTLKL
ncbi:histidine kinase [Chitinophaga pendula]|uniref:sensor histidine kinase n=1 Tax=Chitinophaga TaxID=79328 RepID=UPI0012FD35EE|nr:MULTISPECIES: sensor histidine kinase [Chitinophaga]UCJ07066.1 histidine kinase [Chitinophaga pendula]